MRLTQFRVHHYKSIRDSGLCWLASDLTVIAGKNESGKTALLEALRDFDVRAAIAPAAEPIDTDEKPLIEAHFEMDPAEILDILDPYSEEMKKALRPLFQKQGIRLFKQADGTYRFDEAVAAAIHEVDAAEAARAAEAETHRAEAARRALEVAARLAESAEAEDDTAEAEDGEYEEEDEDEEEDDVVANPSAGSAPTPAPPPVLERVLNKLPRFVFFSSFDDTLPFEITAARAKKHKAVQDFAAVAGLNLDDVFATADTQRRMNLLASRSATISGDFRAFWHQESVSLTAASEGQTLVLGVQEEGRTVRFKPEQRSKGFQWFLSFYLRLKAQGGTSNVILIDEPGLYLHARAQEDVLDVLENISRDSQVIFSTHSPYLLNPDRLDRIRLVRKDVHAGSTIQGKVHADADSETLTPLITAVGLDISREFAVAGTRNVLLEGITDYSYLQAMRSLVPKELTEGLSLIPAVGAQNVPKLASLLIGWELPFVAVLDRDTEGKRAAKTLVEKLLVSQERLVFCSKVDGESIEDLFTNSEFARLVLEHRSVGASGASNSRTIKTQKLDSALLAYKFLQRVRADPSQIKLAASTIHRFEALFTAIRSGFEETNARSDSDGEADADQPSP